LTPLAQLGRWPARENLSVARCSRRSNTRAGAYAGDTLAPPMPRPVHARSGAYDSHSATAASPAGRAGQRATRDGPSSMPMAFWRPRRAPRRRSRTSARVAAARYLGSNKGFPCSQCRIVCGMGGRASNFTCAATSEKNASRSVPEPGARRRRPRETSRRRRRCTSMPSDPSANRVRVYRPGARRRRRRESSALRPL